jgi:hypothetical protein
MMTGTAKGIKEMSSFSLAALCSFLLNTKELALFPFTIIHPTKNSMIPPITLMAPKYSLEVFESNKKEGRKLKKTKDDA